MYNHRTRNITIAGALLLSLGALTLIPGDPNATAARPAVTSLSSTETLATIDSMLDTTPIVPVEPVVAERVTASPAAEMQTAALETTIPETPVIDPSLRSDSIGSKAVNLRSGPSSSTSALTVLQPGQPVHVGANESGWVEVTLDDGTKGFIFAKYLASVATAAPAEQETVKAEAPEARAVVASQSDDLAGRTARIEGRLSVKSKPSAAGRSLFQTEPGERVRILAVEGNWLKVRTADGTVGWIKRA